MDFTEYFFKYKEQIKNDPEKKFVIILGSGFHKEAFGKDVENHLTSWRKLLESVKSKTKITSNNYILEFEQLVTERSVKSGEEFTNLQANKIENSIKKQISENLSKQQRIAFKNKKLNYPLGIFNPIYVSDVIVLNFDLMAELLLLKARNKHIITRAKKTIRDIPSSRYRIINGMRFWHPHGDIDYIESMVLGIRRYGLLIKEVEALRKRYKGNENTPKKNYIDSWFDHFVKKPVIVAGAGFSESEWDLWFALANRMRNYSKKNNKDYEPPIFKIINPKSATPTIFQPIAKNENNWKVIENLFSS